MNKNDKVIVLRSNHPDIQQGDKGIIDSTFCDGIGVRFKKNFYPNSVEAERVVYFNPLDLELDLT